MVQVRQLSGYQGAYESDGALSGLGWCGPSCWTSHIVGAVTDVFEFGSDVFDTILDLPGDVVDAINHVKHSVFDGWAEWVKLNKFIGRELVNAFNAAYDGVLLLAEFAWEKIGYACRLFREYKEYINIGIQVAQQDYANAAANLAEVAAKEMGLPPVIQGTDSQIVQAAEFLCAAVDGINVVVALAEGVPVPPPLSPTDNLVIKDGVAVDPTRIQIASKTYGVEALAVSGGQQRVKPALVEPVAKKAISAPTVIIGASTIAALILLSR